jgi:hypothetical protein
MAVVMDAVMLRIEAASVRRCWRWRAALLQVVVVRCEGVRA